MHLLLVDDDPGLRALLRTTFEVVDIDLDEAGSALEAEALLEERRPDAIVLDVSMPGMSGLDLCRRLKARPETRDIPVGLLTGSEMGTEEDSKAAGANAFVRKPFSP
ncbi:MAG TPA: response regulator, partial [Actinomycetota bacterium]|nr:response regulator [Actinomycetota bacterium]